MCGPGKILSVSQLGFITCRMGLGAPLYHRVGVTMKQVSTWNRLRMGPGHAKELPALSIAQDLLKDISQQILPNKIAEETTTGLKSFLVTTKSGFHKWDDHIWNLSSFHNLDLQYLSYHCSLLFYFFLLQYYLTSNRVILMTQLPRGH